MSCSSKRPADASLDRWSKRRSLSSFRETPISANACSSVWEGLDTVNSKLDSLIEVTRTSSENTTRTERSQDESLSQLRGIENKIKELADRIKECRMASIPREIEYNWTGGLAPADLPILLLDASRAARSIYIPRVFCNSLEDFHDILKILFRNLPGFAKSADGSIPPDNVPRSPLMNEEEAFSRIRYMHQKVMPRARAPSPLASNDLQLDQMAHRRWDSPAYIEDCYAYGQSKANPLNVKDMISKVAFGGTESMELDEISNESLSEVYQDEVFGSEHNMVDTDMDGDIAPPSEPGFVYDERAPPRQFQLPPYALHLHDPRTSSRSYSRDWGAWQNALASEEASQQEPDTIAPMDSISNYDDDSDTSLQWGRVSDTGSAL
ncbi:hypothetical protein BO70DRAFT_400153 [Aspergillus heteromorphus CBS 117.55]|uniref:Uncharacterized protein n=1 Tax=Aspergillus heteromorphus CBS 117.55 TaxID=1448321 RepID=A0A317V7R7_9EURO|nr:uncharacterized protein BO70DRAFT_400153 [Aspergillus heteromorphus CBS 117.55]PWY69088.1 hypothetical protein BO70DRAFT_400153 [Aspergillus heteromorphus CBS 117.55]